jgi:hypothetical protein
LLRSRDIDGLKLAIFGETGDREVRGRGAIDDRHNDARRQEGKRDEQADVPFALGLTLGNLGEGGGLNAVTRSLAIEYAFSQIDGYRCLSLIRALAVVNCQSALA